MTWSPPTEMALSIERATRWHYCPVGRGCAIPDRSGAYALAISLERSVEIVIGGHPTLRLAPGRYIYSGSARGPGGLRSRLSRHFDRGKRVHWHIDQLTTARGSSMIAWPAVGGDECRIVASLLATGSFDIPAPGFGSSDCRRCASHLLRFAR